MIVESLFDQINAGREGLNRGLFTGLPKLDELTYGLIRENITLIGGTSGSGKSSLTSYIAVYQAFKRYLESDRTIDIHWLIFSFEMSKTAVFLRLLSMHLYEEYNIIVPHDILLSLTGRLPDSYYEKILDSREWLSELESRCEIIDKPVTARGLYAITKEWTRKFGTYKEGEVVGEFTKEEYIPNNPQQYLVAIIDHVKLFAQSTGRTSKQEIDDACGYAITFRDKCKMTWYLVQQLNRDSQSMARRTEAGGIFADPQLSDFSDTSGTVQASNTVLAIFHPFREKVSKFKDYIIDPKRGGLGDRMRGIFLLKNRDGNSDKCVGLNFFGECHMWRELPKASEIKDYEPFTHL